MKKCFKCGRAKPLDLFYRHPATVDKHLGKCKACTKKDVKDRYYENFQKIQEYERKRLQTPHRKKKVIEYQRKRRELFPGKDKARWSVISAVRNGKLKKMPCEVCNSPKVQGHHIDYRRPLEVKWLCFLHHRQEHGQMNH